MQINSTFKTLFLFTTLFFSLFWKNGNELFAQAPNWAWAKKAGTNFDAWATAVAADDLGNSYAVGTYGPSLTFGSSTITSNGFYDAYLVKYDANGNAIWAKGAGGSGFDNTSSVTTDHAGNIYVTGWFDSPSITFGSTTLTNVTGTSNDIFIVKYDSNGNVLWAKSAGGTGEDSARCVTTDALGNC